MERHFVGPRQMSGCEKGPVKDSRIPNRMIIDHVFLSANAYDSFRYRFRTSVKNEAVRLSFLDADVRCSSPPPTGAARGFSELERFHRQWRTSTG